MPGVTLDRQIAQVVDRGNCSGCGACALLDRGIEMRLGDAGYSRPARVGPSGPGTVKADFDRICPGAEVRAAHPSGAERHPALGPSFRSWQAWATDEEARFTGSSGGAITAVLQWLLRTDQIREVVEAAKAPDDARRTVTVALRTPSEVIGAAGSRYAPVSNAGRAVLGRADVAFVGKPCEVTAVRALARESGQQAPLLISFFCAGTPSQSATDALADRLSDGRPVVDLWYRGRGWPGSFTVTTQDGDTAAVSYDESWGKQLGPSMQWRCKICPDGVGESADIVAADYWESDADGYPLFDEGDGVSAVIARTTRGRDLLESAFRDGVLDGSDLDLEALAQVQPLQVERRLTLAARLTGVRLAGGRVPRYRGFELLRLTPREPRRVLRIIRGTFRRVRAGRARN